MTQARPKYWKNYDDFAYGIATNRLPSSEALAGQTLGLVLPGATLTLEPQPQHVLKWRAEDGESGSGWYDAVQTTPTTWFIDLTRDGRPDEAITVIADVASRRVLAVTCTILDPAVAGADPRVAQRFDAGTLDGGAASGEVPAPTRDLIGLRTWQTYSPNHTYEHTYLNSQRYAWQCLVGVQRGHGAVDLASYYRFAKDQYIFTFREFLIPVASVFFFDFAGGRSTGKFLGLTGDGKISNSPAGSFIRKASVTTYAQGEEPV
ncbi:MAG: MoaF N-terminal domain-containing protein [Burkholderiaceae bacterium]|nr:MoaF N-terminal domain-containing protein [Burkholderiaceae bacterium]